MLSSIQVNYAKRIVCLANSRKLGGRCLAGKEVFASGYCAWIRPVSGRVGGEVELWERQYEDGMEPKLLDLIEIPMFAAAPHLHQTENHMIDARWYWEKKGTLAWRDLDGLVDSAATLWANGDSTKVGRNDRVSETIVAGLRTSLLLIRPDEASIEILTGRSHGGESRRRFRSDFYYKSVHYNFGLTDPEVEKSYFACENGVYRIDQDAYFCVSLTETAFEGNYYKLVASIITEKPLWGAS